MRWRYVHLGINPVGAVAHLPANTWPADFYRHLEFYLSNFGGDWYRYASQNYVLWTNEDLGQLSSAIARLPGFQNVYVLVTEIPNVQETVCNGWMPQGFWQWIQQSRGET